ncbi:MULTISPECIES: hypothetical protein [unclassified Streptomyces]|uniref:hypothetical protein n=1 Tax=unclassified Streptomyces TaxID=2593676 RepID=UPI002DD7E21A|nr:hypothetical protein [Streptomyces sp. NBC_01445]WSE09975.1 hypothetical protein OG574_45560 [Streptomyces sp. NBC_01445]
MFSWRSYALAAVLAIIMALTGAWRATAGTGPHDISRPVFYLSLHPETAPPSSNVLAVEVDYDGPLRTGRITVDAGGIKGVAQISEAGDGCSPREGIFRCDMNLNPKSQGWSHKELVMRPATGAKAGDSGVLRYTVTAAGVSPVRGSITVIAGRPELHVNEGEDVRGHGPGDAFDVPVLIRNTGDVPARGVALGFDGAGDVHPAAGHRNCARLSDNGETRCLFPDAVIAPGETWRVAPLPRVRTSEDAVDARLSYAASAYNADLKPGDLGRDPRRGKGPALRLERDPGEGGDWLFTTDAGSPATIDVPVTNDADFEARGDSLSGAVGTEHKVSIGYVNHGPADPNVAKVRAVFTVPPGAKVVQAPYDPELEEEEWEQHCLTHDGGRTYTCDGNTKVGRENLFEFTLRIVRKDSRPGSVAVSAEVIHDNARTRLPDQRPANDKVEVRLTASGPAPAADTDTDAGGLEVWTLTAGAAAVVGAGGALVVRRMRRESLADPAEEGEPGKGAPGAG